jgi:predicted ATPase
VTFLVGENGTGKSTLVEATTTAAGFISEEANDHSGSPHSPVLLGPINAVRLEGARNYLCGGSQLLIAKRFCCCGSWPREH